MEGVMEVRERSDGLIELDWWPPRGPYGYRTPHPSTRHVVLTKAQWDSLVAEMKWIAKVGL
jgi:hypothetical protein